MSAEHNIVVGIPSIKLDGKYKIAQAYIKVNGSYRPVSSTDISIKVRTGVWGAPIKSDKLYSKRK